RPPPGQERGSQIAHRQHRLCGIGDDDLFGDCALAAHCAASYRAVEGSSASRMASPTRLKESTTSVMAMPAPMIGHGDPNRLLSPSRMMLPQLGLGARVPMPRKLSEASMRMAEATHSVISAMMGAMMLGMTWRTMMTGVRTPTAMAAST